MYDPDELDRIIPTLPEPPANNHGGGARGTVGRDDDERRLERMFRGRRGEQLRRLWDGDASDFRHPDGKLDTSAAHQSLMNALAFYWDRDPAAMERVFDASGFGQQDKWRDRPEYRRLTIETAIAGCHTSYGEAIDGRPAAAADPPEPIKEGGDGAEACPGCRGRDDQLAQLASIIEAQQSIIATQRAEIERLTAFREEDRRLRLAERELRRLKTFSGTQKDAIAAVAGIAASAASRRVEAPVITRQMVAEEQGCHESTAGPALKVFDLPGSPIVRDTHYQRGEDGTPLQKKITTYAVATANPADIIEAMVRVGKDLAERPRRPGPRPCPKCPGADVIIRTVTTCAECGDLLEESPPRLVAPGDAGRDCADRSDSRVSETSRPGVDVPSTYQGRLARIGGDVPPDPRWERVAPIGPGLPSNGNGNGHDSENGHDRAAAAMVATPLGGDRANGDRDYVRAAPVDSGAARLLITSKAGADGRGAEHAPAPINGRVHQNGNGISPPFSVRTENLPAPCTCDGAYVRKVGEHWLCSGCGGVPVPLEASP